MKSCQRFFSFTLFVLLVVACQPEDKKATTTDRSGSGTVVRYEPLPQFREQDGRRLALVVGISKYDHERPLRNPENDAIGMAEALRDCGFEVIQGTNLTRREMKKAVRDFVAEGADASALFFYYAGHGLMVKGRNYLHPRDAHPLHEADISEEFISLTWVSDMMNDACRGAKILALDCCRNNPVWVKLPTKDKSSIEQGMAKPETLPDGTIMFFATKPSFVATDGEGFHSSFAEALIMELKHSGHLNYTEVFNNVGIRVVAETESRQKPQMFGDYYGKFYFRESEDPPVVHSPENTPPKIKGTDLQKRAQWSDLMSEMEADYSAAERLGGLEAWRLGGLEDVLGELRRD